jgi:hypothetical protein
MSWIPVWFDDDQLRDLANRNQEVRRLLLLETPVQARETGLPGDFTFDRYYMPGYEGYPSREGAYNDQVFERFLDASKYFQQLTGTAVFFLEEVRHGNRILLQLPDGRVRPVAIAVGSEEGNVAVPFVANGGS